MASFTSPGDVPVSRVSNPSSSASVRRRTGLSLAFSSGTVCSSLPSWAKATFSLSVSPGSAGRSCSSRRPYWARYCSRYSATSASVGSASARSIFRPDRSGMSNFGRTSTSNSYSKSPSSGRSSVDTSRSGSLIGSRSCSSDTCSRLSIRTRCLTWAASSSLNRFLMSVTGTRPTRKPGIWASSAYSSTASSRAASISARGTVTVTCFRQGPVSSTSTFRSIRRGSSSAS